MVYVGIDWSITSPSVCVYNSMHDFSFETCNVVVANDRKIQHQLNNLTIIPHQTYTDQNERYHNLVHSVLPAFLDSIPLKVVIEDYSFGSKGKIFNIAECTSILQYHLWMNQISYTKVAPTVLKKFACGKGNATKDLMHERFMIEEHVDLIDELNVKNTNSPVSDIVDSFYLCKYAYKHH